MYDTDNFKFQGSSPAGQFQVSSFKSGCNAGYLNLSKGRICSRQNAPKQSPFDKRAFWAPLRERLKLIHTPVNTTLNT